MSRTNHRHPVAIDRQRRGRISRPGTPRLTRDRDYWSASAPPANRGVPGAWEPWVAARYRVERKARRAAAEQKVRGRRLARRRAAREVA